MVLSATVHLNGAAKSSQSTHSANFSVQRIGGRVSNRQVNIVSVCRFFRLRYVRAHGVGGYPGLRDKPRTLLPRTITDLLAQHIAAHGVIRPAIDGRLTVHGTLQTEALSQPTTAH